MTEPCHYYRDIIGEPFFLCKNSKRNHGNRNTSITREYDCKKECRHYESKTQFDKDVKEMMI